MPGSILAPSVDVSSPYHVTSERHAPTPHWSSIIESPPELLAQETYASRRRDFEARRLAVHKQWNLVSNVRLFAFAGVALASWWALRGSSPGRWIVVAALFLVVIALVKYHASLRRERGRLATLVEVNDLARARLDLEWERLPNPPMSEIPREHPYAWDLDLAGEASLLCRISTPTLMHGWNTLQEWLLAPANAATIGRRQAAVRELAGRLDLRQEVEAAGSQIGTAVGDPEPFLRWSESPPWLLKRRLLLVLAIVSPVALVCLAALNLSGAIAGPWWLAPLTVNVALFQWVGRQVSDEVANATPLQSAISAYMNVFQSIGKSRPESATLTTIGETLGAGELGATRHLRRFGRVCGFVVPRGSIVWSPLQMTLLWDIHVLHALERWRTTSGGSCRAWFERAGEWEALAALSVLAHDHPDWTFPVVDAALTKLDAASLAHPLIHFGVAVPNDVEVGPRGRFLFVSGSNMSGKSTLLRAVGLNAVLAMAGGPVAAKRLSMPAVEVWTCMRVEDSLARGVSLFMAELRRLKSVADAAANVRQRPVLYLLDEILQGTNTAERQIASRRVLAQLSRCAAIGGVSSHDLSLVDGSELEPHACMVHFAETFTRGENGPSMTFDYRLRPGLATSTNALALMKMLGFDMDDATE